MPAPTITILVMITRRCESWSWLGYDSKTNVDLCAAAYVKCSYGWCDCRDSQCGILKGSGGKGGCQSGDSDASEKGSSDTYAFHCVPLPSSRSVRRADQELAPVLRDLTEGYRWSPASFSQRCQKLYKDLRVLSLFGIFLRPDTTTSSILIVGHY